MAKSRYRGVSWEDCSRHCGWRVQRKIDGKPVTLFRSQDELTCAWVADFLRYMIYGTDHTRWSGNCEKPNFAPCLFDGVSQSEIVLILLRRKLLDSDIL